MQNQNTPDAAADIAFLRNTGLALVFLTLMAGSISLIGALAVFPSQPAQVKAYGIEGADNTGIRPLAE